MPTRYHIAFDRATRRWQVRKEGLKLPLITHPSRDEAISDAEKFAEGADAIIILHPARESLSEFPLNEPPPEITARPRKVA